MYQNISTKVLTGEVRLSCVNLTAPVYSVTLLIPKADAATYQDILASMAAARDIRETNPLTLSSPLHDGDAINTVNSAIGEGYRGCWVLTTSTKTKPQVVHWSDLTAELPPQDIYSGMYGRVTIYFHGYSSNDNNGVGCSLGNIMKTRDADSLTAPTYKLDQLAKAGAALAQSGKGKMEAAVALLARYGVQNVTKLKREQYGAFASELRALGAQV